MGYLPRRKHGRRSPRAQAGGIDRPLTIWKEGIGTIVTHQSWRGQFARGTFGNGPRAGQSSDCTEYPATNGCLPVRWPGWNTTAWNQEAEKPATVGSERFWFGSLSVGMRDASGQLYMRNRYYNPQTGQFTQPDPIGLAGGLNSYGFAAGDPVTYSDPYGLCPNETNPACQYMNPWEHFKNDVLGLRRVPMHDNSARRGQPYAVGAVDAGIHTGSVQTNEGGKVERNNGALPQAGAQVGIGVEYSRADSNETEFTVNAGPASVDVAEGQNGTRITSVEVKVGVGSQSPRAPVSITTTEPIQPIRNGYGCAKTGIGC